MNPFQTAENRAEQNAAFMQALTGKPDPHAMKLEEKQIAAAQIIFTVEAEKIINRVWIEFFGTEPFLLTTTRLSPTLLRMEMRWICRLGLRKDRNFQTTVDVAKFDTEIKLRGVCLDFMADVKEAALAHAKQRNATNGERRRRRS